MTRFHSVAKWVSLRLIRKHRILAVLVIASLALGIAQRVGIGLMLDSIQNALVHQSKSFLLADIEIRSVDPISPEKLAQLKELLPQNSKLQTSVECLSIAVSSSNYKSTLVSLKAVDQGFPLYGQLKLKSGQVYRDSNTAIAHLQRYPEAWIDPTLKITLGLKEGDIIYLGKIGFLVKGYIAGEPGEGIQGFSFGPRVYVGTSFLQASGLVSEGSRVSHLILIKLPESKNPLQIAQKIRTAWGLSEKSYQWRTPFANAAGGSDIQVTTHMEKAKQWIRLFGDVGQFFSVLSLLMLILSCLAVGTMLRGYSERILPEIGVTHLLGATRAQVAQTLVLILSYFIGLGTVLGLILGCSGFALIQWQFQAYLPTSWLGWWMAKPIVLGAIESLVFAFGFGSLPLILTMTWKPLELANGISDRRVSKRIIMALSGAIIVLIGSFFYIDTLNLKLAFGASVVLALAIGLCIGLAKVCTALSTRFSQQWSFEFQYGFNNLYRFRHHFVWAITSLSIGILCLSMVGIFKSSLLAELQQDRNQVFPDLFLVGIFDHQKDDLTHYFYQWTSKLQLSPVIKARMTHINARRVGNVTTNDEQKNYLLNREQNLSFREQTGEGEKLIAGDWMKGWYQVEASLEEWFAKKLDINLGDTLTFDVQGVTLKAKVTSFRTVKWTTFKPNFFILLSPNALKEAPKEWLGTVSGLSTEELPKIQAQLAEQFPSVTTIPVKESVDKIKRTLNLVFHAVEVLSYLAVISAIATLVSVVMLTLSFRQKDVHTLKILGFSYKAVQQAIAIEFAAIVTLSCVIGGGIGTSVSIWLLLSETNLELHIPIGTLWWVFIGFMSLALAMSFGVARYLYHSKPKL